MTVEKRTILTCNHCKKEASFVGERPKEPGPFVINDSEYFGGNPSMPPMQWHRIDPNIAQSLWVTTDFMIGGDFCSPECMRDYLIKKIAERDAPADVNPTDAWDWGINKITV